MYLKKLRALSSSFKCGAAVHTPAAGEAAAATVQVSADIIFDNHQCPDGVPEQAWNAANKAVYTGFILGCPDSLRHLFSGVEDDNGRGMIDRLKSHLGPKKVQMARFNAEVRQNVLLDKNHYWTWFGVLNDLYSNFNQIPDLTEQEKWTRDDLRDKFVEGISKVFPEIAVTADTHPDKAIEDLHIVVEGILQRLGIDIAQALASHSGSQTPTVAGMVGASSATQ
jgi:hypothetical protein